MPPDTGERVRLVQAGLGETLISITLDTSAEELHDALMYAFPRLGKGGGYEFLKLDDASRKLLSVVPPPSTSGYHAFYLKSICDPLWEKVHFRAKI